MPEQRLRNNKKGFVIQHRFNRREFMVGRRGAFFEEKNTQKIPLHFQAKLRIYRKLNFHIGKRQNLHLFQVIKKVLLNHYMHEKMLKICTSALWMSKFEWASSVFRLVFKSLLVSRSYLQRFCVISSLKSYFSSFPL